MLKLSGQLVSKSLIKSGVGEFGEWKIIQFAIKKTYNKKKIIIVFTAKGKNADLINSIEFKEKITVRFIADCKYIEKYNRYFTELKAIDVQKFVPQKNQDVYFNGNRLNDDDYELKMNNEISFPYQA